MTEPELPARSVVGPWLRRHWAALVEWWHDRPFFSALVVMALIASAGWWSIANILDRQNTDELCLRSVVAAQIDRSATLSKLDAERTAAAKNRQAWTTDQQRLFERALLPLTKPQTLQLRRSFKHALDGYLAADSLWQRLNSEYMVAAKRQPVPKLSCDSRNLDKPIPAVTRTKTLRVTSTMPAPKAKTIRRTSTVTRPGPVETRTATVTVTAPPGKHRR
jgi:hypothetical protein